jgi:hypothetical protein
MQRLCTASSLQEAELIVDTLARAGIEARVLNELAAGMVGQIPFSQSLPEIWVLADELDSAGRVLEEFRRRQREGQVEGNIRCTTCGEESPANFELCWNCRSDLIHSLH